MAMRRCLCLIVLLLAVSMSSRASVAETKTDSASVALGVALGTYVDRTLSQMRQGGVDFDRAKVIATMSSILLGNGAEMSAEDADAYMSLLFASMRPAEARLDPVGQQEFVDSAAARDGAIVTPSGLVFEVIVEGEGAHPKADDFVVVNYRGAMSDGEVFDETESPLTFEVSRLTPGVAEGLQMMRPGGRYRLVMPSSLAYGEDGIPGVIPGNAALQFDMELIAIKQNE